MPRKYVVQVCSNGSHGLHTYTLGVDHKWYVATSQPKEFDSPEQACWFFFSDAANNIEPVGSNIWVKGPRGGTYTMRRMD